MAPVKVDPKKVRPFKGAASFYGWLAKHHDQDDEVWIKIHKVDSGLKSITPKEAINVVMCWGWSHGLRQGVDFLGSGAVRAHETRAAADEAVVFPGGFGEALVGGFGQVQKDGIGLDGIQKLDVGDFWAGAGGWRGGGVGVGVVARVVGGRIKLKR